MRKKEFWIILIVMVFALCSVSIGSTDTEESRETIRGIQGVAVVVDVTSNLNAIGVNEEEIRTDAELKLRMAGIRVLTMSEAKGIRGKPALYIYIFGLKVQELTPTTFAFYIQISVLQMALLERNLTSSDWVPTWGGNYLGVRGSTNPDHIEKHIRDVNKDLIDKFINAYLSVNPKGGK